MKSRYLVYLPTYLIAFPHDFRLLVGFISRQEAEDFLHKSENGTFLIRFSDSELGGVTVAWITVNEAGHREVAMLQPFTRKDLMIRSLPDRLKDCPQVIFLMCFKECLCILTFSIYRVSICGR